MSFLKKISKTVVLVAQLAAMGTAMAKGVYVGEGWSYDPARDGMHDVRKLMPIEGGGTGDPSSRFCASGITSADGACYVLQTRPYDETGNKCVVVNPPDCGESVAVSEVFTGNAACFTVSPKKVSVSPPGTVCEYISDGGEWYRPKGQSIRPIVCNTEAIFTRIACDGG
ncbi:MAG: hypothetical protein PHX60_07200 [Giesbergeria sp.]|uniref:hypothetical protein n=1 Tax=Giesbergeria sp. TaxID=2818473 RepID=UPI002639C058|nr:hypothetical protein [Giesbergeria sp.]MDD2609473.1 hypothetical protein [Giesbergeria sp.]